MPLKISSPPETTPCSSPESIFTVGGAVLALFAPDDGNVDTPRAKVAAAIKIADEK
jgi:hypothetical protein